MVRSRTASVKGRGTKRRSTTGERSRSEYHRGLDRRAVAEGALRVLDDLGPAGLTMRRVANELHVRAASLYAHVRDREDMLDGALDLVLDSIELPPPSTSARDWLAAGYSHYRAALRRHPGAVVGLLSRKRYSTAQFRLLERVIEALEHAGLTTDDAVLGHFALVHFTIGSVAREVVGAPLLPAELIAESPVMQRAFAAAARHDADARFRLGLDRILDGVLGGAGISRSATTRRRGARCASR